MEINTDTAEKRTAIQHLNFSAKTSKRASWEAWEITVIGPHLVEVTNASYGYLKEEHSYVVGVEERDGLAVPAECGCPADRHNEDDCKHKVALATVGGPTVLNAAAEFETPTIDSPDGSSESETAADKLRADGGCTCDRNELPCFECYLSGRRALPT